MKNLKPDGWPNSNYANVRIVSPRFEGVGQTGLTSLPAGVVVS